MQMAVRNHLSKADRRSEMENARRKMLQKLEICDACKKNEGNPLFFLAYNLHEWITQVEEQQTRGVYGRAEEGNA